MKKILTIAIAALTLTLTAQAETFEMKVYQCHKLEVNIASMSQLFGPGVGCPALIGSMPKIRYYCKDTNPNYLRQAEGSNQWCKQKGYRG